MKSVGIIWAMLGCATFLGFASGPLCAAATESKYRGFSIDESRLKDLTQIEALRSATREQIDMVCAVGLPADILTFFQSLPLVLVPTGTVPSATPGLYGGKDRTVKVVTSILAVGHKPVLLHELLHAYHDQRLKDGFGNREILAYFDLAKAISAYGAKSHMMQNEKEFFACSATTFLFGVTAQEPFHRDKLQASQPELIGYFQALFGPNSGHYAGTLER